MYAQFVRSTCLVICLGLALMAPGSFAQHYGSGDALSAPGGLQLQDIKEVPQGTQIDPWFSIDASTGLALPVQPLQNQQHSQYFEHRSSAATDPVLQLGLGLLGQALAAPADERIASGFSLNGMVAVRPPIADYAPESRVDQSQNRWEVRVGLPVVQQWGDAGNMTTLKLAPGVAFYSDNDDPFGADKLEQDPLLQFEAHLTRDLLRGFLSLGVDFNYVRGGKTQIDGIDQGGRQNFRTVGVNASGKLSREIGWSLRYSRSQSDQQELDEADWYRLNLNYSF